MAGGAAETGALDVDDALDRCWYALGEIPPDNLDLPPQVRDRWHHYRPPPAAEPAPVPAAAAAAPDAATAPATAGAGDVVIGIMRLAGHHIENKGDDTHHVTRAGETIFVRVVPHTAGDHPELNEGEIRRFAVEFAGSGADRGLLVTEKYSPFEIYERERREPRVRFVTRERLQAFVDALALR